MLNGSTSAALLDVTQSSLYHVWMRIGMMADVYKPHVSGVTHYVELNKRYLEKAGHDVHIITFGKAQSEDETSGVVRSSGLPLGDTGYYLSLNHNAAARRLLKTMDIVHVQHPFVSGQLALRYCKPLGIPIVFTNHTRYDLYARTYLPLVPVGISEGALRVYMPRFCREMSLVISPSAGMAAVLHGMGVSSPIQVIPNGVELDGFYRARPLSRADYGYNDQDILLVYAGRVAFEKNLEFLLRAFAVVAEDIDHVHLLIMGGGSKPIRKAMQNVVSELSIEKRVRFTGMIPYAELPANLLMCDAFVTASVSEVHPLSVIEAMACGLPVAGINSPGVGDTVEDGETGLLSNEDMPGFAAALKHLCQDRGLRQKMGKAARQASARFSIERTSQTLLENYERLVAASSPRRKRARHAESHSQ